MDTSAVVDSALLIAAMHKRDRNHPHALPIIQAADKGNIPPLVLTDFILAETINFLTKKGGSSVGRDALRRLEASQGFQINRVTESVYQHGKNDIFQAIDGLSLVDSITVAYMRHNRLKWIYTFDKRFDRVDALQRIAAVPG